MQFQSAAGFFNNIGQEKTFAVVAETRRKWTAAERKEIVAETEAVFQRAILALTQS